MSRFCRLHRSSHLRLAFGLLYFRDLLWSALFGNGALWPVTDRTTGPRGQWSLSRSDTGSSLLTPHTSFCPRSPSPLHTLCSQPHLHSSHISRHHGVIVCVVTTTPALFTHLTSPWRHSLCRHHYTCTVHTSHVTMASQFVSSSRRLHSSHISRHHGVIICVVITTLAQFTHLTSPWRHNVSSPLRMHSSHISRHPGVIVCVFTTTLA